MSKQFKSQIDIPAPAFQDHHVVPKSQLDGHATDPVLHVPPGGEIGQVLIWDDDIGHQVWKTPYIVCPYGGTATLVFSDNPLPYPLP